MGPCIRGERIVWVWGPGGEEMLGRGLHVGSGGDREKDLPLR